jgi:hypothetical protein
VVKDLLQVLRLLRAILVSVRCCFLVRKQLILIVTLQGALSAS